MKRRLVIGALAAATSLVGCSSAASPASSSGDELRIAFVLSNTSDPLWNTLVCGAEQAAKEGGFKLDVSALPTPDEAKMVTTVDTALLTHPDALALGIIDASAWTTKVKTIMNNGTPVITNTRQVATAAGAVDQPPAEGGAVAADDIKAKIGGLKGTAFMLLGLAKADWQNQRVDPMVAALDEANPDLEWLPNQITSFDVNKGTQITSSMITAHPDLKVIVTGSGPETQAAAAAVKAAGKQGQIKIVGFDGVPAAIDALRQGTITLLVSQPASLMGAELVKMAADAARGRAGKTGPVAATPENYKELHLKVLTPENIDSPESKPYQYTTNCG